MSADIGYGYVRCQPGEIITPDTEYWHQNTGPWVRYDNSRQCQEDIGSAVGDGLYPHRRPESRAEWLARGGDPSLPSPPVGWIWLAGNDAIPGYARFLDAEIELLDVVGMRMGGWPRRRTAMGFASNRAGVYSSLRFLVPLGLPLLPYSDLGISYLDRDIEVWLATQPATLQEVSILSADGEPAPPPPIVSRRPPTSVRRRVLVPLNLP